MTYNGILKGIWPIMIYYKVYTLYMVYTLWIVNTIFNGTLRATENFASLS